MTALPLPKSAQLLQALTAKGITAFRAELAKQPTLPVLRRTHELLEEAVANADGLLSGRQDCVEILEQHMVERGLSVYPRTGRSPPVEGQRRRYRAQQLDGAVFLRLPLATLGAVKGDFLDVDFVAGAISVRKARES